ncbi:MAG: hypothetical protein WB788_09270 [Thermoplasmata archaeon]|nr:hypothetical protein [Thermoplasmata archaeon]
MEYSHRDRRAERDVDRSFFTLVSLTFALVVFAVAVPYWFAGWLGVLGLGVLGVGYVVWSERFLESYSEDRRTEQEGGLVHGLLRAELRSAARPDRDLHRPTARSPHARRRAPGSREIAEDPAVAPGANSGQR